MRGSFRLRNPLNHFFWLISSLCIYSRDSANYSGNKNASYRRPVIRGDIKQWNQLLAEAARDAGVITNQEFAEFQNAGYMGLYGGLTVEDIHAKKGLEIRDKILDFMGSEELIANLFRISQTESKLKRENIQGVTGARDARSRLWRWHR